jgi:hypothetical protein
MNNEQIKINAIKYTFIDRAFPDAHESYIQEWINRFDNRIAYDKCDNFNRVVLSNICEKFNVDPMIFSSAKD